MVRWPIRYAVAILSLVALYFVLFGRQKEPVTEPALTPDDARQALLRMLQHADETQNPRFAGFTHYFVSLPIDNYENGTCSIGKFRIDIAQKTFHASFVFTNFREDYSGKFRFVDGRWMAIVGRETVGCKISHRPEPVNDQRP